MSYPNENLSWKSIEVNCNLSSRTEHQSKKLPATLCIKNVNSHFEQSVGFFPPVYSLFAIYDTLYILCETGGWWWCSSCSCPAVTTSAVKSPSISSLWACLWVEAVPARIKIKLLTHLLYFTGFLTYIYFPILSLSLFQTVAEGLMLGSVTV